MRRLLRRWAPALALVVAFAIVSTIVIPRMVADGSATVTTYELDWGSMAAGTAPVRTYQPDWRSAPALAIHGAIAPNRYGFVVEGFSSGSVAFNVAAAPHPGDRTVLLVTGGEGPATPTQLSLIDESGHRHPLGRPVHWLEHRVDVSALTKGGHLRLEFAATNALAAPQLIADQVQVVTYPPDAVPRSNRWEVAAWVALAVLLALVALGRLRRDGVLVAATGLAAFLVWPSVKAGAFQPLVSNIWSSDVHAKWLGLDRGLLSGTFGSVSALAVQLFHALTPVTGAGVGGARTASMLVGILALVAIYALGRQTAGPAGGLAIVACALLADPFRLSLSSGDSTGTLVLSASLFLIAVHRVLVRRDRAAMIVLGAAGALAILAEPLWWPGVLAAIVLLAMRYVPRGQRRAALGAALLALIIISLPSRVSVAHQSGGDLNGDVIAQATAARNVEFVGRGHGAPPDAQALAAAPTSGPSVGLGDYVLGDHSLSVVAGGALSGAYDGLAAAAARPETGLAGLLAFIAELVGVVFLLVLPRLRLLVLVPALLALVPWFFAGRGVEQPFLMQTGFWPALLVGAAVVAYAVCEAARRRLPMPALAQRLSSRASFLARPGERQPESAKP
jgi:hypothetical protein